MAKNRTTTQHLHCPCCGVPYLTDNETAIVVALYAASGPVCTDDLVRVTGITRRSVRRAIVSHSDLFERKLGISEQGRWRAVYALTHAGLDVARRLTGLDALGAAQ